MLYNVFWKLFLHLITCRNGHFCSAILEYINHVTGFLSEAISMSANTALFIMFSRTKEVLL